MKHIFSLIILWGVLSCFFACTTKKKNSKYIPVASKIQHYRNDFFSLDYPSNWTFDEEINNMDDTIPAMSKGIRTTLYNSNPYSEWHTVMIQKSAMFKKFQAPEVWRDESILLKQFDGQYIGVVDSYMLDSLHFGPYPAAMAGFVVALESGDTLIHKQMVVLVGKYLYYLNNTFDWNDDGTLEKRGDLILSGIHFTNANEQ